MEPLDRTLPQRENGAVLTQAQLIGRDAELAAIRDVVASASGDGGVLRARELFDATGVPWLADRARRELGATGEVSGGRITPSMDDLTPQELQIARLAAGGLSNREIGERLYVSDRTVGYHLYHVYPKLGISGRAQLQAALGAT